MHIEKRTILQQAGLVVGLVVSVLLALSLLEARVLTSVRDTQKDQEIRIRVLEQAINRQTPVLEALGRRLEVKLPGD